MIKDSNGKAVKHNDRIKTERGVELLVKEEAGELFMVNEGNMQRTPLARLAVKFYVLEK